MHIRREKGFKLHEYSLNIQAFNKVWFIIQF